MWSNERVRETGGPYRVSIVCWGNICRSPMAEFVLRAVVTDAGLDGRVVVDSRGTSTEELGNPMDRRALAALVRHKVRDTGFRAHRARQFQAADFAGHGLVLAADHIHERILRRRAPNAAEAAKVRLLRSFDPAAVAAGELGMADPWYGTSRDFDVTYAEIAQAVPGVVAYLRAQLVPEERGSATRQGVRGSGAS